MFGHKDVGAIEALVRRQENGRAAKSNRAVLDVEDPGAGMPAKTLLRRETYFAAANAYWWSR